jgi:hypothetical protein
MSTKNGVKKPVSSPVLVWVSASKWTTFYKMRETQAWHCFGQLMDDVKITATFASGRSL